MEIYKYNKLCLTELTEYYNMHEIFSKNLHYS